MLEPIANSSKLVLPTMMAPASRRRCTTVASYGGFQPSSIRDEHVVWIPRVHILSLSANGTPASAPTGFPSAMSASIRAACWRAASVVIRLKACTSGSRAAMAARCCSKTSDAVTVPEETAAAISAAVVGRDATAMPHR